jgi:hypothetical protein
VSPVAVRAVDGLDGFGPGATLSASRGRPSSPAEGEDERIVKEPVRAVEGLPILCPGASLSASLGRASSTAEGDAEGLIAVEAMRAAEAGVGTVEAGVGAVQA